MHSLSRSATLQDRRAALLSAIEATSDDGAALRTKRRGGASDHIFGLFALIGKRFAPRLRNLKDRKFHTFEKGNAYPALSNHIEAPINTTLILDHWDDLLHLAASITTPSVVPSTILKKLAASPKQGHLARALRELGRLERSLLMMKPATIPIKDRAMRRSRCNGLLIRQPMNCRCFGIKRWATMTLDTPRNVAGRRTGWGSPPTVAWGGFGVSAVLQNSNLRLLGAHPCNPVDQKVQPKRKFFCKRDRQNMRHCERGGEKRRVELADRCGLPLRLFI